MTSERVIEVADEAAMARLGHELSLFLAAGDLVALKGALGAGKTVLARAVLHALGPGEGAFEVPSPTFTLVQPYDFTRVPVHHFDLYRIERPEETLELGLEEALAAGAVLVEWPDRLGALMPADRLDVEIEQLPGSDARRVVLRGRGAWAARLRRMNRIAAFLRDSSFAECRRSFLEGDASTRRYERLSCDDRADVALMDMPARPDGAPVHEGLAYSALVHLAEDVRPFVAVGNALRAAGLNAPELHAWDLDEGLLVIEDFGDTVFGRLDRQGSEIEEAYATACDVLAHVATHDCAAVLPLPDGSVHEVPAYDRRALHFEAGLLLDWFWPLLGRAPLDSAARQEYAALWDAAFAHLAAGPTVWVLRDYHSPNLLWLPQREGLHRLGIIDYQDALMGSPAYDLVSLLQDARIDVAPARERKYLDRYLARRGRDDASFDEAAFLTDYAVFGAQRATKILGIFARLKARDGKPGYLRHVPRVSDYLERNLAHPALEGVRAWYGAHLPHDTRAAAGDAS